MSQAFLSVTDIDWMDQMEIGPDTLSCDFIKLRNAAPLMDKLSVFLPMLKTKPDLVTEGSL